MSDEKKSNLTLWIVIAIVVAIATGTLFPHFAMRLEVGGEIFLNCLMMIVVPLVVMSVMNGILGLGDVRKLGKPGACALLYYMSTTVLAVATGLLMVNLIQPGKNKDLVAAQEKVAQAKADAEANLGDSKLAAEHRAAEAALEKLKTDIRNRLEKSAEEDEDASAEIEKQNRREKATANLKKARDALEDAEQQLAAARENLETQPEDADLKTLASEAEAAVSVARKTAGKAEREKKKAGEKPSLGAILKNLVMMLFTTNLFSAAVAADILPLIVFSIVFAGLLTTMGERVFAITRMIGQINEALMSFVMLLMKTAPIGIFCLVAARLGKAQAEGDLASLVGQQGLYLLTIIGGLTIHAFVTLFALYWIFTRKSPVQFFKNMSRAVLTAFSTASSAATLPVTMECATERAGISKRSTEFVLPLGATINMDGTALYEAAAAVFIAQIYFPLNGYELTWTHQVVIAVTATLAAIGAAGIPEAGLFTMVIVLTAVDPPLPLTGLGMILMVDWLLDRFRTAVNCFGDSVGAALVDRVMPQEEAKPKESTAE